MFTCEQNDYVMIWPSFGNQVTPGRVQMSETCVRKTPGPDSSGTQVACHTFVFQPFAGRLCGLAWPDNPWEPLGIHYRRDVAQLQRLSPPSLGASVCIGFSMTSLSAHGTHGRFTTSLSCASTQHVRLLRMNFTSATIHTCCPVTDLQRLSQ